jgi:cell cycle sensor histidine kinase DivJ
MSEPGDMIAHPPPLAALAHELRTPLGAMVGMADAMCAEAFGPLPPAYADYARLIRETGLHMDAVIAALAETAHAASEPLADAAKVARETIEALRPRAEAQGVALELDLADAPRGAAVPRRVLAQILFALTDNALKVCGPGGVVRVRLAREGDQLRLEVRDTCASSRSESGRAVDPASSGLGLPIVRALCAAHGGAFRLDLAPAGAIATAWLTAAAG